MPGPDRHDGGGISVVTLIIAAAASASAAFVVSRVWGSGTLIGAAVTPIIVAVVTELLRRPATRLPDLRTPPPTGGRSPAGPAEPPVHVYRAAPEARHWRIVAVTALAAFVIGVGLYVVLDRLAGGSGRLVPEGERHTPSKTVTSESQTTTVVTQRTVTVSTVTVQQEPRTVTVPAPTTPRTAATTPTQTTPETQTDAAAPPEG